MLNLNAQLQFFQVFKTFNQSLVEQTCKTIAQSLIFRQQHSLLSNQIIQFTSRLFNLFNKDKHLMNQVYALLDLIIFNISSTFEKINLTLENKSVQEECNRGKLKNDKSQIKLFFSFIFDSNEWMCLITALQKLHFMKLRELSNLCEIIEFTCQKYQINDTKFQSLKPKIEHLLLNSTIKLKQKQIQEVNHLIFGGNIKTMVKLISVQHKYSLHFSIIRLIQTNYTRAKKSRSIFKNTKYYGQQIIGSIIEYLIKKTKNEALFSSESENNPIFQFILNFLIFKFGCLFKQFANITNKLKLKLVKHGSSHQIDYYMQNIQVFKQIEQFVSNTFHSKLGNIMYMIKQLLQKYFSQQLSMDLIKLLFLNRFLLNPKFKSILDKENFDVHTYADNANKVKKIFFCHKIQQLNCPRITEIAQKIHQHLSKTLQTKHEQIDKNKEIFYTDSLLMTAYEDIHQSFKHHIGDQLNFDRDISQTSRTNLKQIHKQQFFTPGLSTVEKNNNQIDNEPMSVKILIKQIQNCQSKAYINLTQRKYDTGQQTAKSHHSNAVLTQSYQQEHEQFMDTIEMLQSKRIDLKTRRKQREAFLSSSAIFKNKCYRKFEQVSERFNMSKKSIVSSRTECELNICGSL